LEVKIHPRREPRMQSSQPDGDSSSTQTSRHTRGNPQRQRRKAEGQAVRGNLETRLRGKRHNPRFRATWNWADGAASGTEEAGQPASSLRRRDQRNAIRRDPAIEPLAKPEGASRGDSENAPAGAGRSETRGNPAADHRRYRRAETGATRRPDHRHRRMDANYWETDSSIAGKAGPMRQAGQPTRPHRRRGAAGKQRGNPQQTGQPAASGTRVRWGNPACGPPAQPNGLALRSDPRSRRRRGTVRSLGQPEQRRRPSRRVQPNGATREEASTKLNGTVESSPQACERDSAAQAAGFKPQAQRTSMRRDSGSHDS